MLTYFRQASAAFAALIGVISATVTLADPTAPARNAAVQSRVGPLTTRWDHAREVYRYFFKGRPDGTYGDFKGALAAGPECSVYGTTNSGGAFGQGSIFKLALTASGYRESIAFSFDGTAGSGPSDDLLVDSSGAIFGTTSGGGTQGNGSVYKLTPSRTGFIASVLYNFLAGSDGQAPNGLVADRAGAFYGTTLSGGGTGCNGTGCGTVFKLTPSRSGYVESILYRFGGYQNDVVLPAGGIAIDATGALYGASPYTVTDQSSHSGAVWKLTPTTSGYRESLLHTFPQGPVDGQGPWSPLLVDKVGNVYGTTFLGGAGAVGGSLGGGTVYKLTPESHGYRETVLYSFGTSGSNDGAEPLGGVVADGTGALYGTTATGNGAGFRGTVFELSPTANGYSEFILHTFNAEGELRYPDSGVLLDASGALFGTAASGNGEVYKLILQERRQWPLGTDGSQWQSRPCEDLR